MYAIRRSAIRDVLQIDGLEGGDESDLEEPSGFTTPNAPGVHTGHCNRQLTEDQRDGVGNEGNTNGNMTFREIRRKLHRIYRRFT